MASACKRARTGGGGDEGPVPVADGFEAPIFGARVVGQVTTLALEGEDGPLASQRPYAVASDRAGGWYVTTKDSLLHVSAAGRIRTAATCEEIRGIVLSPDGSALVARCFWRLLQDPTSGGGAEPWSDRLTANPGQRLTVPDSLTAMQDSFLLYQKEGYTTPSTLGCRRPTGRPPLPSPQSPPSH